MFCTAKSDIYDGELYHLSLCLGQWNTQATMAEQVFQPDVRCCRSDADSPLHIVTLIVLVRPVLRTASW